MALFHSTSDSSLPSTLPPSVRTEFERLAKDEVIGDPAGRPAYAYIRVSSDVQAEDGKTGLPRQLEHIHEVASKEGYAIALDRIFSDDDSGFEFEGRPALTALRVEFKNGRRADVVVMEHLDRLSRDSDWHQGFLLDEMKKYAVTPVFWKGFGSRVERAVMGAVAQDGMEQAKQRMIDGNRKKAESGRVTAKTAAYGYRFVDSKGNPHQKGGQDTHYAIREEQAIVVRRIFEAVMNGRSSWQVAKDLNAEGIQPPKRGKYWQSSVVSGMVRNSLYKGEFVARRKKTTKVRRDLPDGTVKWVQHSTLRPPEEQIIVRVPAIVAPDIWEICQHALTQNKVMAKRRAQRDFLLSGLCKCASCRSTYVGCSIQPTYKNTRYEPYYGYRCGGKYTTPFSRPMCDQSQISAKQLEGAIWEIVADTVMQPDILIEALEKRLADGPNSEIIQQIDWLSGEITEKDGMLDRTDKAFQKGAYEPEEYAELRKALRDAQAKLTARREDLKKRVLTPKQVVEQKRALLALAENARGTLAVDMPDDEKRKIIKLVVDRITLNVNEGWFDLVGTFLSGRYLLGPNPLSQFVQSPE